jgi:uncharacterized protein (DUF302 family)
MRFRIVIISLVAFLAGLIAAGFIMHFSAPSMLMLEVKSPYDHAKTVDTIVSRINAKEGWKVVDVIDQRKAIIDGGEPDPGKITIIELCNSYYSGRMLAADERKKIAVNMPIRIAVFEKSTGEVYLGLMNGYLISKLYGGEMERIIELVSRDMETILSFVNFKYKAF